MTAVQPPPGTGVPPPANPAPTQTGFLNGVTQFVVDFGRAWWSGTKEATAGQWDGRIAFVRDTLKPSLTKNKERLKELTGSDELAAMVATFSDTVLAPLCEEKVEELGGWKSLAKGHLLKIPDATFAELVQANIFQMVVNLVKKADEKAGKDAMASSLLKRIPSEDVLLKAIELVADLEREEVAKLQAAMAAIDAQAILPGEKSLKKQEIFAALASKLIAVAFPNGDTDLILPDMFHVLDLRGQVFKIIQQLVPKFGGMGLKLWAFTQEEHQRNAEILKTEWFGW